MQTKLITPHKKPNPEDIHNKIDQPSKDEVELKKRRDKAELERELKHLSDFDALDGL